MHDLCTTPELPETLQHFSSITASSVGEPEPPAGAEHPEQEKEKGTSNTVNMANLGQSTITNGNAGMLGKRHHSLYEDFNNHEGQRFRKVSRSLGNKY
ncbi:RIMS-binding protein 2-like isoform X13 [Tachysurus ichikawai]